MIERTFDSELVDEVLRSDGIWENIGGVDEFEPPMHDEIHYLLVTEGKQVAGLFILHEGDLGLKIHANMLPEFRGDVAQEAARDALRYGFKLNDTIYAEIPDEFPNVKKFAGLFMKADHIRDGKQVYILKEDEWDL